MLCEANCQAKSRRRAAETHAAVLFADLRASNGTIVANPRRRRGAAVASFRCVGSSSSNPSPYWLLLDIVEPRPRIRSCRRISRTLRRGSVVAPGRLGSYECHDLRDARLSALECSSDSFPNRCLPNAAIAFPKACDPFREAYA